MMYRHAGALLVIATESRLAEVLEARQPAELLARHISCTSRNKAVRQVL